MAPTDGRLEQAAAQVLAGYRGPVAVMSFNPHSIALMARLAPAVPRGIVVAGDVPGDWAPVPREVYAPITLVPDYDSSQSSFISHGVTDARPAARARTQGRRCDDPVLDSAFARDGGKGPPDRRQHHLRRGYAAPIPA